MSAVFYDPSNVVVDASGVMYVADTGNNRIRKIAPDGTVFTLAGNGRQGYANGPGATAMFDLLGDIAVDAAGAANAPAVKAQFTEPGGIAVDSTRVIDVADSDNNCIRKITP